LPYKNSIVGGLLISIIDLQIANDKLNLATFAKQTFGRLENWKIKP